MPHIPILLLTGISVQIYMILDFNHYESRLERTARLHKGVELLPRDARCALTMASNFRAAGRLERSYPVYEDGHRASEDAPPVTLGGRIGEVCAL